jgi:eukaryotic-like serine/threonine-protein kinase
MVLASDSRLGIYVIETQLGAGGMGEVYRARDERLQRTVAIKLLLPTPAGEADRRGRFLQEARTLSALNHPNIVTIHGIGTEGGRDYLVMEYLCGKPLDEVIPRDGLRLKLAITYGLQICEAMCAAHNAGIVHRDLKPANVMVLENGQVKVLDFGLAKSLVPSATSTAVTAMPIETHAGSILGTAPYMSPEQAEGGKVDERSDIFSFGCLFYEMLTGISPFKRKSAISSLSAVLRDQPKPLSEVSKNLPATAERIVRRCLQKDRDRRFQSWADLRVVMEELKEESEQHGSAIAGQKTATPKGWSKAVIGWSVGAALLLAAIAVFYRHGGSTAPAPPQADSLLTSLPGFLTHPNISPDGNQIAFAWDGGTGGPTQIYLRVVGEGEPLRLTNGSEYASVPVWSPDGTSIVFLSSTSDISAPERGEKSGPQTVTRVVVISALGGAGKEIASYLVPPRDLSWSVDGKSVLVTTDKEVDTIAVASKERRKILDAPPNHMFRSATVSPDGHTLALIDSEGQYVTPNGAHIYLQSLGEDGPPKGSPRLLPVNQDAVNSLAWTADSKALIFAGSMSLATSRLWRLPIDGGPETELTSFGEGGLSPTIVGAAGRHGGRMVFLHVVADNDIWKLPMENGKPGTAIPLIASTKREWDPRYSPDGKKIAFSSDQGGLPNIWVANADGYELTQVTTLKGTGAGGARWSPDGRQIAFISNVEGQWEIFMVDVQGGSPVRITNNPAHDTAPMWSPDGKWIYFASDRSGSFEIWKTLPKENATAVQVTHHGGYSAVFSADGKAMFYCKKDLAEGIWKQDLVDGEPVGEEGQVLKTHLSNWGNFDVSRDEIAYVPAEQGGAHLYFYRFANNVSTKVMAFSGTPDFGISLSPVDGSVLFTQVTKSRRELVLVENFQ